MVLRGKRVVVRPWNEADAAALAYHANNRLVWRNLMDRFPHPYTLQDAHAFIRRCAEMPPPVTLFAIDIDSEAIGGIGFHTHDDVHSRMAEVGYWLGETFWGRGLATEALIRVTDYIFSGFDVNRIEGHTFGWNPASGRVLEKAGYVLEGRLRNRVFKDDTFTDELIYARLRDPAPS